MTELITFACGLVASTILGATKAGTRWLDGKIGAVVKPMQPLIVLAVSAALPILANALGITDLPPAEVFAAAPVTTLVNVSARETLKRIRKGS